MTTVEPPRCVRHPDRQTWLSCTRCERPACPECLVDASVGHQCSDCVRAGQQDAPRARPLGGGRTRDRGRLVVLPVLGVLNALVFAITVVQAGSLGANSASALAREWGLAPGLVGAGYWWQPLTSGFLHYGPLHLALNLLALWWIGRELEPALGRARFLAVYLISLLGGSAAVMLFSPPDSYTAGASGAVFGLMGALLVIAVRLRMPLGPIAGIVLINIVISVAVANVSLAAHLGGLAAGAAAAALLVLPPARLRRTPLQIGALALLTVVLIVVIAVRAEIVALA